MSPEKTLLVVEDNEDDVYFLRRALKAVAPALPVRFVYDGQAAVDYLKGTGPSADRAAHPLPALVFLDLKLPFVHGLEVLATIRGTPAGNSACRAISSSRPRRKCSRPSSNPSPACLRRRDRRGGLARSARGQ
jgi:CheY-like chemotaxis protein